MIIMVVKKNAQSCDTKDETASDEQITASVEPKKTEQNVEENKDETENNSEGTDKKDEHETEDKNENVPSDGTSDQNKTVHKTAEPENEGEGEAQSTSTEQVHVDGNFDEKSDVAQEEDAKDGKDALSSSRFDLH